MTSAQLEPASRSIWATRAPEMPRISPTSLVRIPPRAQIDGGLAGRGGHLGSQRVGLRPPLGQPADLGGDVARQPYVVLDRRTRGREVGHLEVHREHVPGVSLRTGQRATERRDVRLAKLHDPGLSVPAVLGDVFSHPADPRAK